MSIAGIPVELKTLLLDHVKDIDNLDDAKKEISKHLIDNTQRDAPRIPNAGMHAIFGPSGSGKTLMVGKIANAAAQEFGPNNVAIISLGDNRLGAWNQTQMIGAQSGVECFRVRDRESFETLNRELSN